MGATQYQELSQCRHPTIDSRRSTDQAGLGKTVIPTFTVRSSGGNFSLFLCTPIRNMNRQALLDMMPVWPGIATKAQKALVDHITANHFLDWGFDVFKLEVRLNNSIIVYRCSQSGGPNVACPETLVYRPWLLSAGVTRHSIPLEGSTLPTKH